MTDNIIKDYSALSDTQKKACIELEEAGKILLALYEKYTTLVDIVAAREFNLAKDCIENGTMWAIKAVTTDNALKEKK